MSWPRQASALTISPTQLTRERALASIKGREESWICWWTVRKVELNKCCSCWANVAVVEQMLLNVVTWKVPFGFSLPQFYVIIVWFIYQVSMCRCELGLWILWTCVSAPGCMPRGQSGGRSGTPRGCVTAVFYSPIVSWKLCDIPLEFCSRAIHLTIPASFQSFDISPTPNYYFQCTVRPLITGICFPVPALSPLSVTKTYSVFDSRDCFFLF